MNGSENQIIVYQPNETVRLDVRLADLRSQNVASKIDLMGAVVLKLADEGKLTQTEVSYLLSQQATLDFKMQGNRYLKISTGAPNEHKNAKGVYRFMPDRKLTVGGTSSAER